MIEEIIHTNLSSFYDEEMRGGHILRFEKKLDFAFPASKNNRFVRVLMLAASIIFFISATTAIILNMKYNLPDRMILTNTTPEIKETEKYYLDAISEKINILTKKKKMNSDLSTDLREIDMSINNISKEFALNPGDERLISAIINVYQTKLDLLDDIIIYNQ